MKVKFESTTSYGSQTFVRGQTYDLADKDAIALGFKKAPEKKLEDLNVAELKAKAIEQGGDPEAVNKLTKKADLINLINSLEKDEDAADDSDD